jgi:ribosome-binding factor A
MPLSHRVERVAEQIRQEVSQILATEVADPGVGLVTVTRVKVTADLSLARIYWTIMGDIQQRKQTTKALTRAASYVRHLLSTRLTLRRSPEVKFIFDQSVAAQDRVEEILQELKQEEAVRQLPVEAASDAWETPAPEASGHEDAEPARAGQAPHDSAGAAPHGSDDH